MNNNLTTSIALCTHNGERFLQKLLDLLASQTRLPDEAVVASFVFGRADGRESFCVFEH